MAWIQASMVITGRLEVVEGEELPLLQVYPDGPVVVGDQSGRMLITISSRPWFVPLTRLEASQVLDVLATEGASALRLSSGLNLARFMTTEPNDSPNGLVT